MTLPMSLGLDFEISEATRHSQFALCASCCAVQDVSSQLGAPAVILDLIASVMKMVSFPSETISPN